MSRKELQAGRRSLYLHHMYQSQPPRERSPVGKRRYILQVGGDRDGCIYSYKGLVLGKKVSNNITYCSEAKRPLTGLWRTEVSHCCFRQYLTSLTCLVVSMLLVNADLRQPRVDGQNFDFVAISKLVSPPHFTRVFGGPVQVPFEYI